MFKHFKKIHKPAFLVAGLGNPEKRYEHTRHNVGFLFVSFFAKNSGIKIKKKEFNAFTGYGEVEGNSLLIMKPLTYMNQSGISIKASISAYKIKYEDVIIIHDDMDIDKGRVKLQYKKGSAGHKGIQSIVNNIGQDGFYRIRIGIGKPDNNDDPSDYVLDAFSDREMEKLDVLFEQISQGLIMFIKGDRQKAIEFINNIRA
ncbi:MAG: aminoacyl-tRNA hydrolase [Deltaproteobacteria bacterium]|nr:aminoacyl-tRNA hydrolase [Deltaproteobacteria bacterium]MCL5793139.1 aminoacyl-tRNA hydrolase [Deltaproteobacteria bacterium]